MRVDHEGAIMTELLKGLYLARYGGAHDADGGVELGLGVQI